jgi:DNA-binding XRE family transcriptional regulator
MTIKRPVVSPAQCRAARALLKWTQAKLAQQAAVARKTVADFELGNRSLHRRTRLDITVALEAAGIEFIWAAEGEGVRFARKLAATTAPAAVGTMTGPRLATAGGEPVAAGSTT